MGYFLSKLKQINKPKPTKTSATSKPNPNLETDYPKTVTPNPEVSGMREECGVFGIYAPGEKVADLTYFGLYALQHRGQESAGIAVAGKEGEDILIFKDVGLVTQVFSPSTLSGLQGTHAIGHVRYSTTGSSSWHNAQPLYGEFPGGGFAVAHNGNLINAAELKAMLAADGFKFRTTSDSEVIAHLITASGEKRIEKAIAKVLPRLQGAYSLVILTENELVGIRDELGFRPLCLGEGPHGKVLASESCALDIVGASFLREIAPGEMVIISDKGISSNFIQAVPEKSATCVFEYIYFARPDSNLRGANLYQCRRTMGEILAGEAPSDSDMVIGIPDSGTPAAIGYAEASGIPFGEGMIKNRYVGRTFIQPTDALRSMGIRLKLNPLSQAIEGKRLTVVDDSVVRGNTSRRIVSMLKEFGAKEVHLRISSPPVAWPCFFGIDTAEQNELIASRMTVEEIRDWLGADSLSYLSINGLEKSVSGDPNSFCFACLNGKYPLPIPQTLGLTKLSLEKIAKSS